MYPNVSKWIGNGLFTLALAATPLYGVMADDLIDAAKRGDVAAVKALLEKKVPVNAALADGTTALSWAVYHDNQPITEMLIKAGADVNAANEYGVAPLHLACTNQDATIAGLLLKAGADPDKARWSGETPLMTCASSGAAEAIRSMIAAGADVDAKISAHEQTALMWAAAEDHPDAVKALIDGGANVNATTKLIQAPEPFIVKVPSSFGQNFPKTVRFRKSSGGFSALLFAAQKGSVESARLLLDAGAKIDYATEEEGSALVVATAGGHKELAMLLLERGANPNVHDGWGVTPLHYAVHEGLLIMSAFVKTSTDHLGWERKNMPDLVAALLDAGADPEARIKASFSYLDNKFTRGNEDPPQIDMTGATPLLLAAASGDTASMRVLVEKGQADKTAKTNSGATLFMLAAGSGSEVGVRDEKKAIEAAKLVLAMGDADINAQLTNDDAVNGPGAGKIDGRTAAHFAATLGWGEMIKFLAANGANLDVADRYGQTPLMIAMGDPEARYYRNIPVGRYDDRFRRPPNSGYKHVVQALLESGAKPFTGKIVDKGSVN